MDINPENLEAFAKLLLDAANSKNWVLLVSLVLMGAVWALRKYAGNKIPFLKTDAGGVISNFLLAALGAAVSALVAGQPLSWPLVLVALKVGFVAAGGYSVLKKLLLPYLVKWLKLDKKPEAEVVKEAEVAGAEAAKVVEKVKFEDLGK